jgi:hypothetical protein
MRIVIVAALVAALVSTEASAQSRCPDTLSISRCIQSKYTSFFPDSVSERVAEKATSEAAVTPASIQDFLPRLAAAASTPGIGEDVTKLGLVVNTPLNDGALLDLGARLQSAVKVNNPEPYAAMLSAVNEARRPVVRERVGTQLDELDDVQLTFTLGADNRRWGRTARFHNDVLNSLTQTVITLQQAGLSAASSQLMKDAAGAVDTSRAECKETGGPDIPMGCIRADRRQALEEAITSFGIAQERFSRESLNLTREAELGRLADLVNNQPQFSAAIEWRPRDITTGPQSIALRLRGETGLGNMNGLRRFCGEERREKERQQRRQLPLEPVSWTCYQNYIKDEGLRSSLRRGDRLWLSVDAVRQQEYDAPLIAEDSATLHLAAQWSFEASAGYGFYTARPSDTDPQRTRVDFSARHAWHREGLLRPERRWVITANVTHRVMDKLGIIAGVQWANKAEFLDQDVRPFGVNFGARYKFDQGK